MALLKTLTKSTINMVGLKVIVLLAVVSLTSACLGKLKTDCTCHKKGLIGTLPGLPVVGPIKTLDTNEGKKHDGFSWVCLGRLLSGIGDKVKDSKSILYEIIHLNVAGTLEDVLSVIVRLSRALGRIIDILVAGAGELFGSLVITIVRIIICILVKVGSPGPLGGLLGIKKSPSHAMCGPDYGCKWGWKRYDGKWDSHRNLLRHYDTENPIVKLDLIFKKYTNGRGDVSLDLVARILYDHIFILGKLSVKSYSNWCKEDIISVYISVVTISGLIGNSCKPGLGLQLVDELESFCYTHFKNSGYKDIKIYNSEIKKKIENVKCWRWRGVIITEEAKKSSASEDCNYDSIDESEESRRSTRTSEEENRSNKSRETESRRTKSEQSSDSSSDISEARSDRQSTKKSSEEDRSEQAQRTKSQQSRDSSCSTSQTRSNKESTKRSSEENKSEQSQKTKSQQSRDSCSDISQNRSDRETTKKSSEEDRSEQAQRTKSQQSRDSSCSTSQTRSNKESTKRSSEENKSEQSQKTKSQQSRDSCSDISQNRSDRETTKRSSEENKSEQSQNTRSQQSRDSDIFQNRSDRETTKTSSGERSDQSSTKSRATDCNQSSEKSNESQSRTDKSSDDSQRFIDSSDSSSVDAGKRGTIITEVISGSQKETKESSKKKSSATSDLELDQTKIDLKDGTITATKVVQTKKSSETEEKSAARLEKQYSAKRTVVDNC